MILCALTSSTLIVLVAPALGLGAGLSGGLGVRALSGGRGLRFKPLLLELNPNHLPVEVPFNLFMLNHSKYKFFNGVRELVTSSFNR